jgi:hypothetical protein
MVSGFAIIKDGHGGPAKVLIVAIIPQILAKVKTILSYSGK